MKSVKRKGKAHLTIILLITGIVLGLAVYSRIMTIVATKFVGDFLRRELGSAMGKAVVIKGVSWNPLGKVTLLGAKLAVPVRGQTVPVIETEKIQTDLTIWDIFFRKASHPLRKIVFVKPRLYFGTEQQTFFAFYNPLAERGVRFLTLPRLYIEDGEVIVLDPKKKIYFTLESISGFIDPAIPIRTRVSLKGRPNSKEYDSFSFHGTINLITLSHDLRLRWEGLKLSSLKRLVAGVDFTDGIANVDLKLERRGEYINPWAGYSGQIKINNAAADMEGIATHLRFDGVFELKDRDFVSKEFLAQLGTSKLLGEGRLFLFGEPEMDINLRSDSLDLEDILGASNLGTASGAEGLGNLTFRAYGKMSRPAIKGEIKFPEVRAFSTTVQDITCSFSGYPGTFNIDELNMRLCGGYLTAEGNVSRATNLNFYMKDAELQELCNILAYTGFMVNPTLKKYFSQLTGRVDVSGRAKGSLRSPDISGFFKGRNINTANQSFDNADARFEYSGAGLKFMPLSLGDKFKLWSEFCSSEKKDLNLSLQINDADVESIIKDLELKMPSPFTGKVSGKVELKGEMDKITSQGHLTIKHGAISEICFESMNLNFRGLGREIEIDNSSVSQEKGKVLNMRGKFLLGADKGNFMEILPSATGFVWEGWNIEKDSDQMEFNMGRNISRDWYLCFTIPADNIKNFPPQNQPPQPGTAEKAELQYRLDEEKRLKFHWKDTEEFIGLEQKFKF